MPGALPSTVADAAGMPLGSLARARCTETPRRGRGRGRGRRWEAAATKVDGCPHAANSLSPPSGPSAPPPSLPRPPALPARRLRATAWTPWAWTACPWRTCTPGPGCTSSSLCSWAHSSGSTCWCVVAAGQCMPHCTVRAAQLIPGRAARDASGVVAFTPAKGNSYDAAFKPEHRPATER